MFEANGKRFVDVATLKQLAAELLSEDADNMEYDRAIINLVSDATGRTQDEFDVVEAELRHLQDVFLGRHQCSVRR